MFRVPEPTALFVAGMLLVLNPGCESESTDHGAQDRSGAAVESEPTDEAPPEADPDTYTVNGTVKSVEAADRRITIAHEDVPGYMPAMTMPFYAADPAMIGELSEGDAVRFTFRKPSSGARHDIVSIEKR